MELLELYADESLKDSIVDTLFEDGYNDFYYFSCQKYAVASLLLSDKEQVSGRKDYGFFRIYNQEGKKLADKLYEKFGRDKVSIIIHYNITLL